jgi:hypothetical protein
MKRARSVRNSLIVIAAWLKDLCSDARDWIATHSRFDCSCGLNFIVARLRARKNRPCVPALLGLADFRLAAKYAPQSRRIGTSSQKNQSCAWMRCLLAKTVRSKSILRCRFTTDLVTRDRAGHCREVKSASVSRSATIGAAELLLGSRVEPRAGRAERKSATGEREQMRTLGFTCSLPTITRCLAKARIKLPFAEGPRNAWTLEPAQRSAVFPGAPIGRSELCRSSRLSRLRHGSLAHSVSLNWWLRAAEIASQPLVQNIRERWEKVSRSRKPYASSDGEQGFCHKPTTSRPGQFLVRICDRPLRWNPSASDLVALKKLGRPVLFQRAPGVAAAIPAAWQESSDGRWENNRTSAPQLRTEAEIHGNSRALHMSEEDFRRRASIQGARTVSTPEGPRQHLECGGNRGSSGQAETGFQLQSIPLPPREVPCGGLQFYSVCRARSFPAQIETR